MKIYLLGIVGIAVGTKEGRIDGGLDAVGDEDVLGEGASVGAVEGREG